MKQRLFSTILILLSSAVFSGGETCEEQQKRELKEALKKERRRNRHKEISIQREANRKAMHAVNFEKISNDYLVGDNERLIYVAVCEHSTQVLHYQNQELQMVSFSYGMNDIYSPFESEAKKGILSKLGDYLKELPQDNKVTFLGNHLGFTLKKDGPKILKVKSGAELSRGSFSNLEWIDPRFASVIQDKIINDFLKYSILPNLKKGFRIINENRK